LSVVSSTVRPSMLSAISGNGEWAIAVFDVSLVRRSGVSCGSDGAIISSPDFRIAQGEAFLKGVLRGGDVASEVSWTTDTLKGLARRLLGRRQSVRASSVMGTVRVDVCWLVM
jgi:hypothetical protein